MSTKDNDRMDELQAVVVQLGNALNVSERRTARLERMIRWGALSLTLAVGLALVVRLQPFGYAVAQQAPPPSKSVEEAIDRLTLSLTGKNSTLGMMGMMMGQMMQLGIARAEKEVKEFSDLTPKDCEPNPKLTDKTKTQRIHYPLGFFVSCYFLKHSIMSPSARDYQSAILAGVSGLGLDLAVLAARVRQDSDFVHNFVADTLGDPTLLDKIRGELALLNQTLQAVPVMAANMNTMTHQMGIMAADMNSMSHSMGSTMGRMGNWTPW